ncbi:hypothetical protein [Dokdonella sp.]|uniref:hypothetical protein n=1 Tax=Dokdonella sp. TaxID=2291710 RepID=UPI003C758BBE
MSLFFNPGPMRKSRSKSIGRSLNPMLKRESSAILDTVSASQRLAGTPLRNVPRRRKQRSPGYQIAAAPGPRMFRVS